MISPAIISFTLKENESHEILKLKAQYKIVKKKLCDWILEFFKRKLEFNTIDSHYLKANQFLVYMLHYYVAC